MTTILLKPKSGSFSIDECFEEEKDEAIRIYGSTTETSPLHPRPGVLKNMVKDSVAVRIEDEASKKKVFNFTNLLKVPDDVSTML